MKHKREETTLLLFAVLTFIVLFFVWKEVNRPSWTLKPFTPEGEISSEVSMNLYFENGTIKWEISNRSGQTVYHGGIAGLQYLQGEEWLTVYRPVVSTGLGYALSPDQRFSEYLDLKPYRNLPNGAYRLICSLYNEAWEFYGYAVCEFRRCGGNQTKPSTPSVIISDEIFSEDDMITADIPMELSFEEDTIRWTITNQSSLDLFHGDYAQLQYVRDQTWHSIAIAQINGMMAFYTMLGHNLSPGQQFSSQYDLRYYCNLSDGTYRLIFPLDYRSRVNGKWTLYGYAACEFQIVNGTPQVN